MRVDIGKMQVLCLVFLSLLSLCCGRVRHLPEGEPTGHGNGTMVKLRMPGIAPKKNDDYLCTAFNLKGEDDLYITQFRVEGSAERAHHMLLYGCGDIPSRSESWDCGHHGVCDGASSIMFAWAKNAPPTSLPPSVGFRMAGKSDIKYLVLQIHYAHTLPEGELDRSGMDIDVTYERQQYIAGIYLLIGGATIPPFQPKVHADACCDVKTPAPIHLFAYRTHAHALGKVITGYKISKETGVQEEIARGNPQWPQAFYGMAHLFEIKSGDTLMARCTYDSTNRNTTTYMGGTAGDEMCNLYLMYYTDAERGNSYSVCTDQCGSRIFPADSDEPLPPNPLLEEHAIRGNHKNENGTISISDHMSINLEQLDYNNLFGKETGEGKIPDPEKKAHNDYSHNIHRKPGPPTDEPDEIYDNHVEDHHKPAPKTESSKSYPDKYIVDPKWLSTMSGQPSAVGIDSRGNIIIFHRADRAWGGNTFNYDNRLSNPQDGPIRNGTLVLADPSDNRVIKEAGRSMFYLPHGLTVDDQDCLWVTDVGAHQVFKLTPLKENTNEVQILMELGKKLQPGSGDQEFCKPTSVAVLPSGEFFVADGYCNSRVIKFSKAGVRIAEWGENAISSSSPMSIPHSVALVPENDLVCVADRENGRIQCFSIIDGQLKKVIKHPDFKSYIYAIYYQGGYIYAVNGPTSSGGEKIRAKGFIIDPKGSGEIVSVFGSKPDTHLGTPHALVVGKNASSIYIADINPFRIVKLVPEGSISSSTSASSAQPHSNPLPDETTTIEKSQLSDLMDISTFSTSMVILSILAVPLLIIIIVVSISKLRKHGCSTGRKRAAKLDLGRLLGHRDPGRGGFEKLAMEDSDGEGEMNSDSDADVVEYTKAKKGNNFKA